MAKRDAIEVEGTVLRSDYAMNPGQDGMLYDINAAYDRAFSPRFSTRIGGRFTRQDARTAALATTTLRVGTTVLSNDFRHPAIVAKEMATLDVLSDGRLEVGIGAGWMPADYGPTGIPFDPAGARVSPLKRRRRPAGCGPAPGSSAGTGPALGAGAATVA